MVKKAVPGIYANGAGIQNAVAQALNAPYDDYTPWEVWFAWHPVKIWVVLGSHQIHDEIVVHGHHEWRWMCCVARRINNRWVRYDSGPPYEYGPATNALM